MIKKNLIPLFFFCLLFAAWELVSLSCVHLKFVLPSPFCILKTIVLHFPRLLLHSKITFLEMSCSLLLSCALAFPLAWFMAHKESFRKTAEPLFLTIQSLPMFVMAPLIVIWFGWSFLAIVFPTMLMILFPLTLNLYRGLLSVPQNLNAFFDSYHASKWQKFFKLQLPYSLGHFFSGCRLAATIAGLGAIASEWIGAQKGLGIVILESRRELDIEMMFAAIVCVLALTSGFYHLIIFIEQLSSPKLWHGSQSKYALKKVIALSLALILPFLSFFPFHAQKHETTLLLDWMPNPNHVPLYVGLEKKIFKEEGIDLELKKLGDTGGSIAHLTSKQADIILYHMPGALKAYSKGANIKALGYLIKQPLNAFIVKQTEGLNDLTHLSSKRLGYCLGSHGTSFLNFLLDQKDVTVESKCNVNIDLVAALVSHRVDFIYGGFWNIETHQLKNLGIETKVFKLDQFEVPSYYEMMFFIRGGSKLDTPGFHKKFQKAIQKSIEFCKNNPDEAFQLYLKNNPHKRGKTQSWEASSWTETVSLLAEDQTPNIEEIDLFYQWLENHHLVEQTKDLAPFLR